MSDDRTPEQIATDIRDAVEALNRRLHEAGEHGCKVEVEVKKVPLTDRVTGDATQVLLVGVFKRVEPEPKPVAAPPARKRGHNS